jgi:tRNA(adenine34) deaminase
MDLELDPASHQHFMQLALAQAKEAYRIDEVPVGAIMVHQHRVIGAAHNLTRQLRDATAHGEMLAITQASEAIGDWRLQECTLYVTLEPCIMCCGGILNSRIPNLVFGAVDPKGGAVQSLYQLLTDSRLNHRVNFVSGVCEQECSAILTDFFRKQRLLGKK